MTFCFEFRDVSKPVSGPVSTPYCPILSRVSPYIETNSGTVRSKKNATSAAQVGAYHPAVLIFGCKLW